MRCAHFIKRAPTGNSRGRFHLERTSRLERFPLFQLFGQHLSEMFPGGRAALFDIKSMRRKASQLIPGDDIGRSARDDSFGTETRHCLMSHIPEADPVSVT